MYIKYRESHSICFGYTYILFGCTKIILRGERLQMYELKVWAGEIDQCRSMCFTLSEALVQLPASVSGDSQQLQGHITFLTHAHIHKQT